MGCFLEYQGSDVDDFDDSVSSSSCPSDYTSGDDFVSSESEGHVMHDLTVEANTRHSRTVPASRFRFSLENVGRSGQTGVTPSSSRIARAQLSTCPGKVALRSADLSV